MKYEVVPAEKSTVKITMTFTPEEWAEANERAYRENRHRYAVNGFRKGKAPKYILEAFYGKGLFYEAALNILFQDKYPEVLESEKQSFTSVGDPEVTLAEDFSETNVRLIAVTPVRPDVKLGAYTGIKISKYDYTITDADVDSDIESTRERTAETRETTSRPAAMGDTVRIDFVGKADGVAFDGGTAKDYDLTLGSGQFIPGFEEGVVGMNVGDVKDVNVVFPEDYQSEELKGKPAVFTVTLHTITEKVLAPLDDDFAKKMGSDTLEAYRGKVRERLVKNAENRSRNETENAIVEAIAKNAEADIPDAMVESQEDYLLQRTEYNLMYQGIRLDDYLSYLKTTREEYKKTFEEEARRNVLHQLIVEKIIELEHIAATEEEVDAKIAEQAASVGKEAEEYKKTMDPRQREYIENDLKVTKVFDFLMANNEMTEVKE